MPKPNPKHNMNYYKLILNTTWTTTNFTYDYDYVQERILCLKNIERIKTLTLCSKDLS